MKSLIIILVSLFLTLTSGCGKKDNKKGQNDLLQDAFPFLASMDECQEIELVFNYKDRDSLILHFTQKDGKWILPDFLTLQASAKLSEMISDLRQMKIHRFVSDSESVATRNEIGNRRIRFKFQDGSVGIIEIGEKDKKGAIFVRNGNNQRIYLSSFSDDWSVRPLDWMNKRLFDFINDDPIEEIFFTHLGTEHHLIRAGQSFLEQGTDNVLGEKINIPKVVAFVRQFHEMEFLKPYPKELWNETTTSKAKYEYAFILKSGRSLQFEWFPVLGKDQVLLMVQDSEINSPLNTIMREGVITYSGFVDKVLSNLIR